MNDLSRRTTRLLRGVALAAATLLAAPAATMAAPMNLTIGSFAQGSSWYVYAVNLGEMLREVLPPGSSVDTPPLAGGLGNPPLVENGKAQIAFGMAVVGNWAIEGTNAYKKPMKDLRALVGAWDEYFLVPMARGAGQPTDMAAYFKAHPKATVTLLQRGSVGAFGGEQMLNFAGINEKTLKAQGGDFEFGSFDMVKNRFAAGTADVFIQTATLGHPSITEMARTNPLTFLEPSQSTLDQMKKRYGWETRTLPKNTFPGQDKDVRLPGTTTTLFASTALSDDLAYKIVKTICENTAKLRVAHKALANFDCQKSEVWKHENTGMPLHAGAERYYRERGWLK